jgi:hypothetical protein
MIDVDYLVENTVQTLWRILYRTTTRSSIPDIRLRNRWRDRLNKAITEALNDRIRD